MGRISGMEEVSNLCIILLEKPKGKRVLGRSMQK
jgi:hypothetical protein